MNNFKKKQAVAPADSAQAVTTFAAKEAAAECSLAMFKGWLLARKNEAERQINATSGDEFAGHCADFSLFDDAAQVVSMFEREARG